MQKERGTSVLTDIGYVRATTTLAQADIVLALVRPLHHHITSPWLRVPTTFVRHSDFVALSLDFGSKGETFARKVAAGSAYTVSHNNGIWEEGGPTRG